MSGTSSEAVQGLAECAADAPDELVIAFHGLLNEALKALDEDEEAELGDAVAVVDDLGECFGNMLTQAVIARLRAEKETLRRRAWTIGIDRLWEHMGHNGMFPVSGVELMNMAERGEIVFDLHGEDDGQSVFNMKTNDDIQCVAVGSDHVMVRMLPQDLPEHPFAQDLLRKFLRTSVPDYTGSLANFTVEGIESLARNGNVVLLEAWPTDDSENMRSVKLLGGRRMILDARILSEECVLDGPIRIHIVPAEM